MARRITVIIEDSEHEGSDRGHDRRSDESFVLPSGWREEESSSREEPHRTDGRCYCPYCWSGV